MQDQKSKIKSKKSFLIILLVLMLSIFCFILNTNTVSAEGISLSVSPSLLRIEAISPSDTKSPITIENQGNNTVDVQVIFRPFRASKTENGEIEYINDSEIPDAYKKIFNEIHVTDDGITKSNFELSPKQKKNLEIQFNISKNEPDSDYYFSVIFLASKKSTQADEANSLPDTESLQNKNFSALNIGIAANILLSVGSEDNPHGAIEEFSAPAFLESGPVEFTVRIKNTGSRVFAPKAIIFIKNMFGQTIGRVELEPDNILADSIRSLTAPVPSRDGDIQTASSSSTQKIFWKENFLLGPYTANLNIAISDKGPVYNQSIIFLALPIPLIIGIIMGIFILIIILLRVRYHLKNDK